MTDDKFTDYDYITLLGKYRCAKANEEMLMRNHQILLSEVSHIQRVSDINKKNCNIMQGQLHAIAKLLYAAMKETANALDYDSVNDLIDDYGK